MNARPIITFAIGLIMATVAVFFVSDRLTNTEPVPEVKQAVAEPPFAVTKTLVAVTDLKFGNRIGREHIKEVLWPTESLPKDAFTKIDDLLGTDEEDRVVLKPITAGEPILANKISGFGERASMSTMIPEGKRAYAIRVNAVSGVAGFLLPGDRVDVLLTRSAGSDRNNKITDVVLQNVVIRGIDQISDEDRNKPQVVRTVTVEVTPDETQKLALAMQVGTLSLALRNLQSSEQSVPRTIGISDLNGDKKVVKKDGTVKTVTRPKPPSVRVRRGSDIEVVRVDK